LKRKTLIRILIAEGVLLAALSLLTLMIPTLFSSLLSFPLEQIALGMRSLSLTGTAGNGIAMLLIALSALIPVFFALRYPGGRETLAERIALFVLALMLPVALYGILNPGMFYGQIPGGIENYERVLRVFLSLSVWTVVILFIVLRLIRLFRNGNREQLFRYLRNILCALCVYFTAQLVINLFISILTPAGTEVNTAGFIHGLLSLITVIVPLLLDILVALRMLALLETAATEEQEGLTEAAGKLSRLSCITLAVTSGLTALLYIAQILLLPQLSNVSTEVHLPITDLFFVLVILLLSRLLIENKQLRDDNSLFI